MILISNDRTSASKKTNRIALIRTLTVLTTAFGRMKEEFNGFRQTVKPTRKLPILCLSNKNYDVTSHRYKWMIKTLPLSF